VKLESFLHSEESGHSDWEAAGCVRNSTLVEVCDEKQSEKLLKAALLGSYPIKVERHMTLNSSLCVVRMESPDVCPIKYSGFSQVSLFRRPIKNKSRYVQCS
jgi:hypothetical protein